MSTSKAILRGFSLHRFYVMLTLTVVYFLVQLVTAHFTHSLILQVDAYHMLYNILSLTTCIVTVRLCREGENVMNTFGWTRLHVCGAVANICFLAALGFSLTVESLQTIIHADHHDSMHSPLWVGLVGAAGVFVNAICFFTIGGYTFHQSSFLDTEHGRLGGDGEDFVNSASVKAYVERGMKSRRRQGFIGIFRDIFGSVLVVICAVVVYYFNNYDPRFLDPVLTIFTVITLGALSYRIAKDAGHILLLTIPNHINVKTLLNELKSSFPELYDIHDFHVWQLTPARIIASAHIVLQQTQGYLATQNNIVDFLQSKGISQITLQPEFLLLNTPDGSPTLPRRRKCFLPCEEDCQEKQCCGTHALSPCNSHQEPIDISVQNVTAATAGFSLAPIPSSSGSSPADENVSEETNLEPELQPMI